MLTLNVVGCRFGGPETFTESDQRDATLRQTEWDDSKGDRSGTLMRWVRPIAITAVIALVGISFTPQSCGACPPSGGPSESLQLSLEAVHVDGALVDTIPYGLQIAEGEGVGPTLGLRMERDGVRINLLFAK
jgi:hypothetical protein